MDYIKENNSYSTTLSYKKYKIIFVSVVHNKRDIPVKKLKKIISESEYKNICYLLEVDKNKKKLEVRKYNGDQTTKFVIDEILKLEKLYGIPLKTCMKGWDIRQSILTQNYQDYLYYGDFRNDPIRIINFYIDKLKPRFINDNNLDKKIKDYLNIKYKQVIDYNRQLIFHQLNILKPILSKYKDPNNTIIKDIIKEYNNTWENFKSIIFTLQRMYAEYSDLYILEMVLKKDINTNYYVFVGDYHYRDLLNVIKQMEQHKIF